MGKIKLIKCIANILFIAIILAAAGSFGLSKISLVSVHEPESPGEAAEELKPEYIPDDAGDEQKNSIGGDITWARVSRPEQVRGIYISAAIVKNKEYFYKILDSVSGTSLNAVVIDIKDDNGFLAYPETMVSWAEEAGAVTNRVIPEEVMPELARRNIYPIARIVVFKDSAFGLYRPDFAVLTASGEPWTDWGGNIWFDPYNKEYWQYIVAISREAAEMGFQEIQYDYIRFPSDGNLNDIVFPAEDGTPKNEVIPAFLRYAKASLKEYGVEVSADVYGLVTSTYKGMGIGQVLELIAAETDIICPMLYPSHYESGNYGFGKPGEQPYGVVYKALKDAKNRLGNAGIKTVIRPWLQDFTYKSPAYWTSHVKAQVQAADDMGVKEFLLWNPANIYHYGAVSE